MKQGMVYIFNDMGFVCLRENLDFEKKVSALKSQVRNFLKAFMSISYFRKIIHFMLLSSHIYFPCFILDYCYGKLLMFQ